MPTVPQYQSPYYDPAKITGRTVRYERTKALGPQYYVREYETDERTGMPGEGEFMSEYRTDGEEIPEVVKFKARKWRASVRWV